MTRSHEKKILHGESVLRVPGAGGSGGWVERDGERYYRIANYHAMPPFLVSVVSGSDHWLFVSSSGGLTCGRRAPENALFPYCTDDKLHDAWATTGPRTLLLVERDGRTALWRPFDPGPLVHELERNLYKNVSGSELVFEERNRDLGLAFSYAWTTSERYGFVRRARLENTGASEVRVELVDGLRNLLPWGVDRAAQSELSTLVDAYKRAEAVPGACAALYTLSSLLTDRAEPSEALRATVVWSTGLDGARVLLTEDQLPAFCAGGELRPEPGARGRRGAFFVHVTLSLPAGERHGWHVLADVEQGPSRTVELLRTIRQGVGADAIERDVAAGRARLERLVAGADGRQRTADEQVTARHFSNALFNIMRGGVFPHAYEFPRDDFLDFVGAWHRPLRATAEAALDRLEGPLTLESARRLAEASGSADLVRLVYEYLPLSFSRRHGDPSRPWNHFSIELRDADGAERLYYQGNWRDIFQNWEALALSFPEYLESFIAKFVNASTADGYNPYRISREGLDWEVPEPDRPWSNIGYWGDHQVCYLLRLLELSHAHHPGRLDEWLDRALFVHADVPYRISAYAEMLRDPRSTVGYDEARARAVAARVAALGADGKLVTLADGSLQRVSLMEKLLLVVLVRLANLVPGGGIWMNTQRPEWNDANNALVGHGLSMVTLCYLRRYLLLLGGLLEEGARESYELSRELVELLRGVDRVLRDHADALAGPVDAAARRSFLDAMGAVGERHRERVYAGPCGERDRVPARELRALVALALEHLDHSIRLARRPDGLYHAYNLLHLGPRGVEVEPLDLMLEGQVAVLSSGALDGAAALELLAALRASRLYRADQRSYVLYPDRELPAFLERNVVPPALVAEHGWLERELAAGRTRYVERDVEGRVHFNAAFRNEADLRAALARDPAVDADAARALCGLYEAVFEHRRFTGRSGSMFKYEGLGCIYWHMVSKLLLAIVEVVERAVDEGADAALVDRLAGCFEDVQDGLGVHKSPAEYGAFPTDPYSHTPSFVGVQQPGLTGQVKEDVITRFRQLGVRVRDGALAFEPLLLSRAELLRAPARWRFAAADGSQRTEELPAGSLAFTLCGVPVVYRLADERRVHVVGADGTTTVLEGGRLTPELSRALFRRERRVHRLQVDLPEAALR